MDFSCISFVKRFIILVLLIATVLHGEKLPTIFKKCHYKDQTCFKKSIQAALPNLKKGIPELSVPPLDPLFIPEMVMNSSIAIQKYTNISLIGSSDFQIEDFEFNLEEAKFKIRLYFDELIHESLFDYEGKLFFSPIHSKGKSRIMFANGTGFLDVDVRPVFRKKQMYLKGVQAHYSFNASRITFDFKDEIKENQYLSRYMNKAINDNWREIFDEIKDGFAYAYAMSYLYFVNSILTKVPIIELFEKSMENIINKN